MGKPFKKLRESMSPEARARAAGRTVAILEGYCACIPGSCQGRKLPHQRCKALGPDVPSQSKE